MKILITGGCGFVGSNLALHALQKGHDLHIVDNLYRVGSRSNLDWLQEQGKFVFHNVDTSDSSQIEAVISKFHPDAIFHMAGQVAMTTSIKDPMLDFRTNALGTLNLLEAVRKFSPESIVIYSSTNKVYGDLEYVELEEHETRYVAVGYPDGFDELIRLDFHSPYGCSKGAADQYLLDYHRIYDLNTVVFRHSSIYGGRQFANYDQGWIGWFCQKAIETEKDSATTFSISGNGKQVRDVLYATDLVNAYFAVLEKIDLAKGHVFNLGGGMDNSLSLLELFALLEEKLDVKLNYQKLPWRISDQKVFVADNSKAKRILDWTPQINANIGLNRMLKWCRSILENNAYVE